ncbi:putative short-chain dehydrogenase/reductase family 42E member 2 [Clupea harengus]|uniref:Short-chain dehydrogenase/reductase family 42E member 2 n=1 Tax=Clupea harengus TaxID=7950 RepID=A0A6P3VTX9_CLUHA|nr:putative short-chain dehydrogenase/reductase family 42E member 2 [Clupea harengus]
MYCREQQRTEAEPGTMKQNGASCAVEPAPCPCLLDGDSCISRSQTSAHDSTWATNGSGVAASAGPRNRPSGAVGSWCSSPECVASQPEAAEKERQGAGKVLVTGGAGYFGFRLGRTLASQGVRVVLLDLHKPLWDVPDGAVFYQSDIRDYESLYKVCEGVDCIFHTAAYGMSGPEQLKRELVESINVGGTNNVINVCSERGITRLVYTSTVNVAFAGKPIEDGDEDSVALLPLEMHIDHYSRTKAIADRMVLAANGRTLKGGGVLLTCTLRPSGIYGPEERRHLHRVMVNVERRLFSFSFGNPRALMNWVHVDNLVTAHLLAAEALTPERRCVASGQAYFINDGVSVNIFEWFRPLFEKLGYSRPLIHLPVCLVYTAAVLMERVHLLLRPFVEIPLLFTRNEVRNIAISHTFKIDKARRELGFSPKKYSLSEAVDHYLKNQQLHSSQTGPLSSQFFFLMVLLFMGLLTLLLCSSGWDQKH